jgi:hypothetical protein
METAIPGLLIVAGKLLFQEYTAAQVSFVIGRVCRVAGMAALGAVTTCGDIRALCLSLVLFYFWGQSKSRTDAGKRAFYFFLGATWILPEGIVTFFDGVSLRLPMALFIWVTACFFLSIPFGALFRHKGWQRALAVPAIFLSLTIPPLGFFCVVHPLIAAGVVFPGLGWWGVAGSIGVAAALSYHQRAWAIIPPIVATALFAKPPLLPNYSEKIEAIYTSFAFETGDVRPTAEWQRANKISRYPLRQERTIALLPESIGGQITGAGGRLWEGVRQRLGARALIIGGERSFATHRENALFLIEAGANAPLPVYTQRIPVPFSMWKPWAGAQSYPMSLSRKGTFLLEGRQIGALICYEALLALPIFSTMSERPEQLVVAGNLWWAKRTHLHQIVEAFSQSWARLFGVPVVVSLNR